MNNSVLFSLPVLLAVLAASVTAAGGIINLIMRRRVERVQEQHLRMALENEARLYALRAYESELRRLSQQAIHQNKTSNAANQPQTKRRKIVNSAPRKQAPIVVVRDGNTVSRNPLDTDATSPGQGTNATSPRVAGRAKRNGKLRTSGGHVDRVSRRGLRKRKTL